MVLHVSAVQSERTQNSHSPLSHPRALHAELGNTTLHLAKLTVLIAPLVNFQVPIDLIAKTAKLVSITITTLHVLSVNSEGMLQEHSMIHASLVLLDPIPIAL
jgi:hypothetical protein